MRIIDKQSRNNVMTNVKYKVSDKTKGFNFQCRNKEGGKMNKEKGIQCHECEGL